MADKLLIKNQIDLSQLIDENSLDANIKRFSTTKDSILANNNFYETYVVNDHIFFDDTKNHKTAKRVLEMKLATDPDDNDNCDIALKLIDDNDNITYSSMLDCNKKEAIKIMTELAHKDVNSVMSIDNRTYTPKAHDQEVANQQVETQNTVQQEIENETLNAPITENEINPNNTIEQISEPNPILAEQERMQNPTFSDEMETDDDSLDFENEMMAPAYQNKPQPKAEIYNNITKPLLHTGLIFGGFALATMAVLGVITGPLALPIALGLGLGCMILNEQIVSLGEKAVKGIGNAISNYRNYKHEMEEIKKYHQTNQEIRINSLYNRDTKYRTSYKDDIRAKVLYGKRTAPRTKQEIKILMEEKLDPNAYRCNELTNWIPVTNKEYSKIEKQYFKNRQRRLKKGRGNFIIGAYGDFEKNSGAAEKGYQTKIGPGGSEMLILPKKTHEKNRDYTSRNLINMASDYDDYFDKEFKKEKRKEISNTFMGQNTKKIDSKFDNEENTVIYPTIDASNYNLARSKLAKKRHKIKDNEMNM